MKLKFQRHRQFSDIIWEVLKSAGSPIDSAVRALMEARFGCDFGEVRLHSGDHAALAARFLGASAFTVGPKIVFGEGRCDFGTAEGLWLLAHELVHVIQQRGGLRPQARASSVDCLLEQQANHAADLIAAGQSLTPDFSITATSFGAIQCHNDAPCPGTRVSASDQAIYMPANQAIERAYKDDKKNARHAAGILVGSDFDRMTRDILVPAGAPNRKFANALLTQLRGIRNQRRPDIIDFVDHVIYEIKSTAFAAQGDVQIQSYYEVVERILRVENREPPWRVEYATWYPPHVLPLGGNPTGTMIVCTEATDYKLHPGVILYEVRELDDDERRRQRQRHAIRFEVSDFDQAFDEFWPAIRSELPKSIRLYDPDNPDYVIIVPDEFYKARYQQWTNKTWDKLRVKPRYDFPGGRALEGMKEAIFFAEMIIAGVSAVVIVVAASAVVLPAGAAAATGAASAGGAAGAGGAEIVSLAAYRAASGCTPGQDVGGSGGCLACIRHGEKCQRRYAGDRQDLGDQGGCGCGFPASRRHAACVEYASALETRFDR